MYARHDLCRRKNCLEFDTLHRTGIMETDDVMNDWWMNDGRLMNDEYLMTDWLMDAWQIAVIDDSHVEPEIAI